MAEKCPFCNTKVKSSEQQVRCPSCGALYHYGCWKYFTEKCAICGLENEDYKEAKRQAEERKLNKSQPQQKQPKQEQTQQETKTAKEYVNTTVNYAQTNISNTLNDNEPAMFANVGEKLKSWAKATAILGIVIGIITFLAMAVMGSEMIFIGLIAGVLEALSAWAMALILYAFGELVSNSKESKKIQQQILDELKKNNKE